MPTLVHFIVYSEATGAILRAGGPVAPEELRLQASAERGEGVVAADGSALTVTEIEPGVYQSTISLAAVRRSICDGIDTAAGAARAWHIATIPGQEETYRRKEAEARAWAPGADPAGFPFLAREAVLSGLTLADLVAEVLAVATAWQSLAVEIEGARMSSKRAVMAAADIPAMVAAAAVDWNALAGTGE